MDALGWEFPAVCPLHTFIQQILMELRKAQAVLLRLGTSKATASDPWFWEMLGSTDHCCWMCILGCPPEG